VLSILHIVIRDFERKDAEPLYRIVHEQDIVRFMRDWSEQSSSPDLLFIVGGIYAGKSDPRMVEYVQKLDSSMVKRAVLITSCASKQKRQDMVRDALVRSGIQVASDEFVCRGSFLFMGMGHPNSKDIDGVISFVRKVASASEGSGKRRKSR